MLVEALSVRFRSDERWKDRRWWVRYQSSSTALYAAHLYPSCWDRMAVWCGALQMCCILPTATQSSPLHFIVNFLFRYRDDICILAIILSSPAAVSIISMIKQKLIYNLNKSSQPGQRLPLLKLDIQDFSLILDRT